MTDYKLTMLARAEKAGVAVHSGLRVSCNLRQRSDFGAGDPNFPDARGERHPESCPRASCIDGFVPNHDPMALIAACQKSGAMVSLGHSPEKETPYVAVVGVTVGHGSSNLAALTDTLFQRTKRLASTNWEKCSCIEPSGATCSVPCPDNEHLESCVCTGTGIVIKEAGNGN